MLPVPSEQIVAEFRRVDSKPVRIPESTGRLLKSIHCGAIPQTFSEFLGIDP